MTKINTIGLNEIIEKYKDKKVFIFGAGVYGKYFIKEYPFKYNIVGIVDNGKVAGRTLYGKKIFNFSEMQERYKDELIIIASLTYKDEMIKQLQEKKFRYIEHFCIWDCKLKSGYNYNFSDENTKKFVDLNKKLWKSKKICNTNNKILVPYRYTAEVVMGPWSYCANLFAQKYNAEIWAIGGNEKYIDKDLWELYKSINTVGYIDETPNQGQVEEIDKIFKHIWKGLKSIQDVKNITVYGENYGIEIVRDYLRLEYPQLYINDISFEKQLRVMIGYIVFWNDYIKKNCEQIKTIIVWDGTYYREGIIRKIAYSYNIPVYSIVNTTCFRWGYDVEYSFKYYNKFFYMLSEQEKIVGLEWAKKRLNKRINGNTDDMLMVDKSAFSAGIGKPVLEINQKLKIMICPHYFEDDAYPYGKDMLFADQWDWLNYLGELSNNTEYDWYLKPHPIEKSLGDSLIEEFIKKYPKIKLIDKFVSPIQLKNEGMKFALTIHGSIGYEYPLIGINVINAGFNPHVAFNFDIMPKTQEEYKDILLNLKEIKIQIDVKEIYKFYAIHFGYYNPRRKDMRKIFFKDARLQDIRGLVSSKTEYSTDLFKYYVDEIDGQRHNELLETYKDIIDEMDEYKEGVFYKKKLDI